MDEYLVEAALCPATWERAKEYLAAAMEELGYSDVSQLPQLELITWDTSEQEAAAGDHYRPVEAEPGPGEYPADPVYDRHSPSAASTT